MSGRRVSPAERMWRVWRSHPWLELLVLSGVIWLAHFQLYRSLGMYEDDHAFIGLQLGWKPADPLEYMKVVAMSPQGRLVQFLLPRVLTVAAGYLDGIRTLYIFASLIQPANGLLFYFLLRRLGLGTSTLVGATIFSLYPADTTHAFLMHGLGTHRPPSMAMGAGDRWVESVLVSECRV